MTTQAVTHKGAFSADDISALFAPPPRRLTPLEVFEISRKRLADAKLAPIEMFDSFAKRLPPDGVPFLLLPSQPKAVNKLDWNDYMARLQLNGKTGKNFLTVKSLSDLDPIVTTPRMLISVEDGRGRLNTKPSVSEKAITTAGRFGYNLWAGYIHAVVYTKVLGHHYMDLVRSRCGSGDVPYLCLNGGAPALNASWSDLASPVWGAPSFGSQIDG